MAVNWTNVTTAYDFLSVPNTSVGGYFWTGILFLVWIVLCAIMMIFGFEVGILGASFICLLAGILLAYAGLMSWTWVLWYVGVIVFIGIWVYYQQK